MGLQLPLSDSPLRQMFDTAHLVEMVAQRRFITYREAKSAGVPDGAHSVNRICLRADGDLWLVQVGKRGGVKKLWNFGRV